MAARILARRFDDRLVAGVGALLLMAGLVWMFRLIVPVGLVPPDYSLDFDFQLRAARELARGGDPYAFRVLTLDIIEVGYAYPPLMAWALAPLGVLLPDRWPYLAWVVIEAIAYGATIVVALRAGTNPVRWPWVLLILGLASLTFNVRDNLFHGQADLVLATLVTFGLYLVGRDRPIAAGLLLAAAANVKPFLAILLVYLAWRAYWRAFFAMGFGGLGILVLSFLPTLAHGPGVIVSWFSIAGEMGRPPFIGFMYNHALYGLVVRLFTPTPFAVPWVESRPIYLGFSAMLVVLPIAVWLVTVRPGRIRRVDDPMLPFLEAGLILALIFSFGPVAEANHMLSLAALMLAVGRMALLAPDDEQRRRWLPAAIAWIIFLVLAAGPTRFTTWTHPIDGVPSGLMVLATARLGFVLLAATLVTAWSLRRELQAKVAAPKIVAKAA